MVARIIRNLTSPQLKEKKKDLREHWENTEKVRLLRQFAKM